MSCKYNGIEIAVVKILLVSAALFLLNNAISWLLSIIMGDCCNVQPIYFFMFASSILYLLKYDKYYNNKYITVCIVAYTILCMKIVLYSGDMELVKNMIVISIFLSVLSGYMLISNRVRVFAIISSANLKWLFIATITFFCISFWSGYDGLHDWPATQMLINYDVGFAKRGLVGYILNLCFDRYDWNVSVVAHIISALSILLLFMFIKSYFKQCRNMALISFVVFASSTVMFFASTIGYFDHIGLLCVLIILLNRNFMIKLVLTLILFVALVFVHEGMIVIFAPVAFMSLLVYDMSYKRMLAIVLIAIAVLGLTLWVSGVTVLEHDKYLMIANIIQKTDYRINYYVFDVITRDMSDNRVKHIIMWQEYKNNLLPQLAGILPLIFYMMWLSTSLLKQNKMIWKIPFSIVSSLSPQLLHFVAWDMGRWNSLTVFTSFLTLCAIYNVVLNKKTKMNMYIFLGILILSFLTEIPLMKFEIKHFLW